MPAESFPDDCQLRKDVENFAKTYNKEAEVLFSVQFPENYPFAPPFVRVVRPRFQFRTGHITVGGSVCSELLSTNGWSPSYSVEMVFVQARADLIEGGGRIDMRNSKWDYTDKEAREAFNRVASRYGWKDRK